MSTAQDQPIAGAERSSALSRLSPLAWVNIALLVQIVVHIADHARQDRSLTTEIRALGILGLVVALVALGLALKRHRWAPAATAAVGFGYLLGIADGHLVPHWGAFSDPYGDAGVDALSWILLVIYMAVALAVGLAGLRALRESRGAGPAAPAAE